MKYKTNELGDVEVLDEKGIKLYLPVKVVEQHKLMERLRYTVLTAPEVQEPLKANNIKKDKTV